MSARQFCEERGIGPLTAEAVKDMDAGQLPDYAFDRLLHVISSIPAVPGILMNRLVSDRDLATRVWVTLSQEHDSKWGGMELMEVVSRLGIDAPPKITTTSKDDFIVFDYVAAAFDSNEKSRAETSLPSDAVYTQLMQQHAEFGPRHLAPYTTVVGPSGIGKSFSLKQLAVRHGLYISYSNLSPASSIGYPRPVRLGTVPSEKTTDDLVEGWCIYLKDQVQLANCCRDTGLTAPGLFHLLTSNMPEIKKKRAELEKLFQTHSGQDAAQVKTSFLLETKALLESTGLNRAPLLPEQDDENSRPVIICFDEARALLDQASSNLFRALRRASALMAKDPAFQIKPHTPSFFLVLLDTTSKISNFTPSLQYDTSARLANRELFPPIHQINSLNVFSPRPVISMPVGTEDAVRLLFSCGRPLWGALLQSGDDVQSLLAFAVSKVTTYQSKNPSVYGLAILSYRMRFYISSPALSEELVASMMRYIIAISSDRSSLLTTHPSEPVLAYVASRVLQDPDTRCSCIRSWIHALQTGTINPGDVGEQVATLVLLFAFDYVAAPAANLPQAITLESFLTGLLGDAVWDKLSTSFSEDSSAVGELLTSGSVFFNHCVRAVETPTLQDLRAAYSRGFAIFLPTCFPGADLAIPVCIPQGQDMDHSPMGLLLIQVKNRRANSPTRGLELVMTEYLDKSSQALGDLPSALHGIIGLSMCLRTSGTPQFSIPSSMGESTSGIGPAASTRKRRKLASGNKERKERQFLGTAFGLDATVYPCLQGTAQSPPPTGEMSSDLPSENETSMTKICAWLRNLLGNWPETYSEKDTASDYSKSLLDPFLSVSPAERVEEIDENTGDMEV